ncbi:MAG: ornithine carbamoyltransferase [Candidatus Tectomicrobia bacterium]|nr:ornithine carbamoyltransferase [Candidatus Tectomicrobia bacterium]
MIRHLRTIVDLSRAEIEALLELARLIKRLGLPESYARVTRGKTLGMLFQKPSTRTRVSFEVGMVQLGGSAIFLTEDSLQLKRGETIADTAAVLSRYLDLIVLRTRDHGFLVTFAEHASIPVINGLTDQYHPCQILSDLLTIQEKFGGLRGIKLTYLGDGNNIAHSWLLGAAQLGLRLTVASPAGYEPEASIVAQALELARETKAQIEITHDPIAAVQDADILYTDVWVSMGMEETRQGGCSAFHPYQINGALLARTGKPTKVMHCLPAHRGEEITDDVLDSSASIVFDQAENRLHLQKALVTQMLVWAAERA